LLLRSTEQDRFPRNFLRHYYDVYCLLDDPSVQKFIGKPEYAVQDLTLPRGRQPRHREQ
jgi:hypothetical protein